MSLVIHCVINLMAKTLSREASIISTKTFPPFHGARRLIIVCTARSCSF
jgi:hypothetical protein